MRLGLGRSSLLDFAQAAVAHVVDKSPHCESLGIQGWVFLPAHRTLFLHVTQRIRKESSRTLPGSKPINVAEKLSRSRQRIRGGKLFESLKDAETPTGALER
jgi:hypothetical protein